MSETIRTISNYAQTLLSPEYDITEIKATLRIIFEECQSWSFTQQVINYDQQLPSESVKRIKDILKRLSMGEPLQYIFGYELFMGLKLKVDTSTLIPRPETEELVQRVAKTDKSSVTILDIGTGSGAIAIALAKKIERAKVTACDISKEAIGIAQQNAESHNVEIKFIEADILNWENYRFEQYNIIVSNPPYITESEKQEMERRVLEHEPHSALFVPDTNPLLFYRRIAQFGTKHLENGGELWFEINRAYGKECCNMLQEIGYCEIELYKDNFNNDRIVRAKWMR